MPTYSAADELRLCIESLQKNSELPNRIMVTVDPRPDGNPDPAIVQVLRNLNAEFHVNEKRLGAYGSWNSGANLLDEDVLCFVNDDQYFAPQWDTPLLLNLNRYPVLTGVLVEPGIVRPYETNLIHDFGLKPEKFDEQGFLEFVRMHSENRIAYDGFYIPTVISRRSFEEMGKWPVMKEPARIAPDLLFRRQLQREKVAYHRSLASFSYHFQSSSQPSRPHSIYFERSEVQSPRTVRARWRVLNMIDRFRSKLNRTLNPEHKPSYSFKWPKREVSALLYRHCLGHGIEIGSSTSRIPNVNTYFVDIFGTEILPEQGKTSSPYQLSSLPIPQYDFLIASNTVEYLDDPKRAFNEWKRIVKDTGKYIFIIKSPTRNLGHHSLSKTPSPSTFTELLKESNFEIIELLDASSKDGQSGRDQMLDLNMVARRSS